MNSFEETEVIETENIPDTEAPAEDLLLTDEYPELGETVDETPAEPKRKKAPYIQTPVLISLGLVVLSLLAFFAYKIFWIAEPEGVTWVWQSEEDDINWYYEFKNDNVFKAYVGSFEVTANYAKDKSDETVNKLMISANIPYAQSLGCVFFGNEMNYTITGSRIAGSQEMTVTYPEDTDHNEFVLKQTRERDPALELPDDFTEDQELTGEWINVYSSDDAKQVIVFNDDGSMILSEIYAFSADNYSEIRRNCTYTVDDGEINITWKAEDTVVHHSEYQIRDGILTLDDAQYYRAGNNPATPDESK